MFTQNMLTNVLCVVGFVGVAVLQHFNYIDPTLATVIYTAIGTMGGYKNAASITTQNGSVSTKASQKNVGATSSDSKPGTNG